MLVYGRNVAKEILKNNKIVKKIILQEDFSDKEIISLIEKRNIKVEYLDKKEFSRFDKFSHQGNNLGAIIRTCEAAGITGVIIPRNRSVDVNSTVMKTSAGALENVKIAQVTNLVHVIGELKENGFWIVGTAMHSDTDYRDIDYTGKIALVIGNEGKGMSKAVTEECDFVAKIPMYGKINSLNASVAAGIMIYEMISLDK